MDQPTLKSGTKLLGHRYQLLDEPIARNKDSISWVGATQYGTRYLVKVWPFPGVEPPPYYHALWDAELRTMYRLGSSPGAEETILVIRDAGLDREAHCFVMVLEAKDTGGYETLAKALTQRDRFAWLSNRDAQARRQLWQGLQQVASGLQLLHNQYILHRDICPEAVFFHPQAGSTSLRLGGFEWSVRLGVPHVQTPPPSWSSPPEFFSSGPLYRPETDWYAFGMLAVRCLLPLELYATNPPADRHNRVLRELDKATTKQLSDLERTFLRRLIDLDAAQRLTRGHEIRTTIRDVLAALDQDIDPITDKRPLVLVIDLNNQGVYERASEVGFVPDPAHPKEPFSPINPLHVAGLTQFIQADLVAAQLYAVAEEEYYVLAGVNLTLRVRQFEYTDWATSTTRRSWDWAYCMGAGRLYRNEGGSACQDLPEGLVTVRTLRDIYRDESMRQNARSWERYLPTIDQAMRLRTNLARFHEFIRCTNQLELLIRDAEIFPYTIVAEQPKPALDRITIREAPRQHQPPSFCLIEGGLTEFLHREIESKKPDCDLVVLTGPDEAGLNLERTIPKEEFWKVVDVRAEQKEVVLERSAVGNRSPRRPKKGICGLSGCSAKCLSFVVGSAPSTAWKAIRICFAPCRRLVKCTWTPEQCPSTSNSILKK